MDAYLFHYRFWQNRAFLEYAARRREELRERRIEEILTQESDVDEYIALCVPPEAPSPPVSVKRSREEEAYLAWFQKVRRVS